MRITYTDIYININIYIYIYIYIYEIIFKSKVILSKVYVGESLRLPTSKLLFVITFSILNIFI